MLSWLTWPVDRLALKLSERRIVEIKESLGGAGYVDDELWSNVRHISEDQAHDELERGVKVGRLERWLLYQDEVEGVSLVVPEALSGKSIRLSDAGYFRDDEITISKYAKHVYVAAGSASELQSNVAEEGSDTAIGDVVEEEIGAVAVSSAAEEGSGEEAVSNAAEEA